MKLGRYEIYEPVSAVEPREDWLSRLLFWREREYVATLRSGKQIVLNEAEKAEYDAAVAMNQQAVELYHVCVAAGLKPNGG